LKSDKHIPPRLAQRFLYWFLRDAIAEEVQGDLYEQFYSKLDKTSLFKAKLNYWYQVFNYIRPFAIRKSGTTQLNQYAMFQNYLKVGWRNLLKYRSYSTINILGLSVGFAATIILLMIMNFESSYDRFHEDPNSLFRVGQGYPGGFSEQIVTPQIPLMKEEYSEIIGATRFFSGWYGILQHDNNALLTGTHLVDEDFPDIFNFRVLQGNMKDAFSTPNQIILTESYADKLISNGVQLGETVTMIKEDKHFTVAAIVEDPPKNSSLQFEVLIPWINAPSWLDIDKDGNWYNMFMTGYVKLSSQTNARDMEEKFQPFVQRHFLEERRANSKIILLPLVEEHFRLSKNKRIIAILGIIGGAVLLISCLNFMNLSISQLLGRTKEIGIRKVMGSRRGQLIYQFIVEGFIVSSFAILAGIIVVYFVIPYVNSYFDFGIRLNIVDNLNILYYISGICILTIFLCTLWPSIALSGLKPVNSMKGIISKNKSGGYFRKGLIVLQFSSSIFLIIGSIVIWSQIQFMKDRDLNFNGNNVVVMMVWSDLFKDPEKVGKELFVLRDQLKNETVIQSASLTECVPGAYNENYNTFHSIDSINSESISLRQIWIDHEYFNTFQMNIIEGHNFSPDLESDKNAVIINEAAMKRLGWDNLKNKQLRVGGSGRIVQVIGVVEDYNYQSLKRSIQPVVHWYNNEYAFRLAVRLDPERISEGLVLLEKKWNELGPYESFDYSFVDQTFDELYKTQEKLGTTSSVFSMIGILIAGFGLYSITSYSIQMRKKEIGIRKVLGASILNIINSLSRNYGILVLIAFVLACPVAYFLTDEFLKDFSFRINLSLWLFLFGGALVFTAALLIVGIQSGKAALENPVNSLRDE
jgi:putative ABC transport system permease protein